MLTDRPCFTHLPTALVGIACASLAGCGNQSARAFVKVSAPVLAIAHVRVIDGLGGPAKDNETVVVRDGKIAAVGSGDSVPIPHSARVIDGNGKTIIPGLVGMHEHLFYETQNDWVYPAQTAFSRLYLAAGVTTIRTAGTVDLDGDLRVKRDIDGGRLPGPDIDVTTPYLYARSGPPDPASVRREVNKYADEGATSVKAYDSLRGAELRAAIETAHSRGLRITGHLCAVGFEDAISMGIDNLEHGLLVDTDFEPNKQPDVCPTDLANVTAISVADMATDAAVLELINDLVRHGVAITSTLAIFETFTGDPQTQDPRLEDMLAPHLRSAYETARAKQMDPNRPGARIWSTALWHEMQFEHEFAGAGGKLMAGVDPTGWGGVLAGFGDQRELELLVMAGFTPEQAIQIASYNGAEFEYATDRVGSIQVGRQADLVLVRGNPSKQISDVRNVETVFKDGVGYDPDALLAATRGTVGEYDFTKIFRFPGNLILAALIALQIRKVQKYVARRQQKARSGAVPANGRAVYPGAHVGQERSADL